MRMQYDMSTSQIIESDGFYQVNSAVADDTGSAIPALQLMEVTALSTREPQMPPELAAANISAFLDTMN